jgi:signal peptidase I
MTEKLKKFWKENGRPFLVVALVVFSFRSAFADWNDVPTGSMKPTIMEGDRVVVNKLAYDLKVPFTTIHMAEWGNPQRGDIVVFYSPEDGRRLVKRVIGLPGDVLEMHQDALVINGKKAAYASSPLAAGIDQSAVQSRENLEGVEHPILVFPDKLAMRDFGPMTVPAGSYFMMGDNRDDSYDSRYFGSVARRRIVGEATAVAASFDRDRYFMPRFGRFFKGL